MCNLFTAVFISVAIFGGIHIQNIFFVAPITLLVQVINVASSGVLFEAIYIRCKNIWATIIIHMLVDWLALFVVVSFCFWYKWNLYQILY